MIKISDFADILNHMNVVHEFDYKSMKSALKLNFYQQIKLINFIRRQMHLVQCMFCNDKFNDFETLFSHMKTESHLKPPLDRDEWDQSQFYFPTYENDNFLCLIEDEDDLFEEGQTCNNQQPAPVIPQDLLAPAQDSILFKEEFRKQLQPKHKKHK